MSNFNLKKDEEMTLMELSERLMVAGEPDIFDGDIYDIISDEKFGSYHNENDEFVDFIITSYKPESDHLETEIKIVSSSYCIPVSF